jgi:hypothetical protein
VKILPRSISKGFCSGYDIVEKTFIGKTRFNCERLIGKTGITRFMLLVIIGEKFPVIGIGEDSIHR